MFLKEVKSFITLFRKNSLYLTFRVISLSLILFENYFTLNMNNSIPLPWERVKLNLLIQWNKLSELNLKKKSPLSWPCPVPDFPFLKKNTKL